MYGSAWLPLVALTLGACGAGIPGDGGARTGAGAAATTGKRSDSQSALFPETRAGWRHVDRATRARIDELARDYADFLGRAKTPRRAVRALVDAFRAGGRADPLGATLAAGQRAFWIAPGGDATLLVIGGRGGTAAGVRAVVVAVDGPRLDLKHVPLYQHGSTAMFETALYGQLSLESWLARPLALYLRLDRKKQGDHVIGVEQGDPVLAIPDVPIHLAKQVQDKKRPVADPERMDAYAGISSAAVRAALRARGLVEADLVEAEAYLVPAGPAVLVGADRAMVAGYGQSRLGLAYLATRALGAAAPDQATLAVILVSKSQIKGTGSTGVPFVGHALSRAMSALGGELDVLTSRRAHARSALLVAATSDGQSNAGLILSPEGDDALPAALRRALDRLARVRVPVQIGAGDSDAAVELGMLDLDAVAISLPVRGMGAPLELVSALDLHYGMTGLASWFAP